MSEGARAGREGIHPSLPPAQSFYQSDLMGLARMVAKVSEAKKLLKP
jgi:hypothetical protein